MRKSKGGLKAVILAVAVFLFGVVFFGKISTSLASYEDDNPDTSGSTTEQSPKCETNAEEGSDGGLLFFKGSIVPCGRSCDVEETTDYDETDSCTLCHFILMAKRIYDLLFALVVFASILMITIGGTVYLVSAGNRNLASTGKDLIVKTLWGFALFLLGELIVFTALKFVGVNFGMIGSGEKWYQFECESESFFDKEEFDIVKIGAAGTPGTKSGPAGTTKGYEAACPDSSSSSPIDYSKAASDPDIKLSSSCDKYDFSNSYGVDACVLKAMAQMESSCGANKGPSSHGACGLMQILPSTASELAGRTVTCDELKSDDALSIQLAAQYTSKNLSGSCVQNASNDLSAIFAGYNSGYGCGSSACSGSKKASLCPSSDCSGALAFECCIKPGGLDESINYAWNGMGLYSQCKGSN